MNESEIKALIELRTGRIVLDILSYSLNHFVTYTYRTANGLIATATVQVHQTNNTLVIF